MKKHLYPILIFLAAVLFLFIRNFTLGTYLSGWDNLLPEFNFSLNIQRSLFAVWQEYQGLGLLGGMGHAADLPRQLLLFFLSFFLPTNLLRYTWTFLMLFAGPAGVYFLAHHILGKYKKGEAGNFQIYASFISGIFYLFNLVTVQTFITPYDAFVTNYGFFPWLLLATVNLIEHANRKNLLLFILINLLGMTANYIPTLFLVNSIVILPIGIFKFIEMDKSRKFLRNLAIVFITSFIINAFWLLPFTYFTFTHAKTVVDSKINRMATGDVYLRNKQYGTLTDTLLLKNFWFSATEYYPQIGQRVKMLENWDKYISATPVKIIGIFTALYIVVGFFLCLKEKKWRGWAVVGLIGFTFIASDSVPFSWVVSLLRSSVPLLSQFFRFPFIKWDIALLTSFSIFLGVGAYILSDVARKRKIPPLLVSLFFLVLIAIFNIPFFTDNLISPAMKVKIPKEYFELFDYFKTQPDGRIAVLPQYTFWDWRYYNWGELGSGFLWYGIKQPILDRAFDSWNSQNEEYYWEMSQAIYSDNGQLFSSLLHKYQIHYLILDESIINISSPRSLYIDRVKEMIGQNNNIVLAKSFGKISAYIVNLGTQDNKFIVLAKGLPLVGPQYTWNNYDKAYLEVGDYLTSNDSRNQVYYPFRSLFTGRKQEELEFGVEDMGDYFSFTAKIPKGLEGQTLLIPPIAADETQEVDPNNLDNIVAKYPDVYLDGKQINATINNDPMKQLENGQQKTTLEGDSLTVRHSEEAAPSFSVDNVAYKNESVKSSSVDLGGVEPPPPGLRNSAPHRSRPTPYPAYQENDGLVKGVYAAEIDSSNAPDDLSTPGVAEGLPGGVLGSPNGGEVMLNNLTDNSMLEIRVPKINGYYSANLQPTTYLPRRQAGNLQPKSCDQFNKGVYEIKKIKDKSEELLRLTSVGSSNCLDFDLPNLAQRLSYLITIDSKNIQGKSLLFALINKNSERADIETYLPKKPTTYNLPTRNATHSVAGGQLTTSFFVVPPMEQYGVGYTIHLDNISIGRERTVNDLGNITVNPIPYNFLTSIKLVKNNQILWGVSDDKVTKLSVEHPNPSYYEVQLDSSTIGGVMASAPLQPATPEVSSGSQDNVTLVLSQSFDNGWKAYEITNDWLTDSWYMKLLIPLFAKKLDNHVLVNNWENGWEIGNQLSVVSGQKPVTIVILYLPQYLEYLGFGLLGVSILYLLLTKQKKTS